MPLSNAEKQRRYRERLKNSPEKQEEIRKKNLARIKKKVNKVKDMTEQERNYKRNIWRNQQRNQKAKKINIKKTEEANQAKERPTYQIRIKKVRAAYKKCLCKIENLKKTIQCLRKRVFRAKAMHHSSELANNNVLVKKDNEIDLLKTRNEILEKLLKSAYKTGSKTSKRHLKSAAINETRTYNTAPTKRLIACSLGLKKMREYKKRPLTVNSKIREDITHFFTRDDISRITAGKKECRTQKKEKKQIRYLTDTLANLYKIYKSEGSPYSFTTFFCYKPFYVLSPTVQSNKTCMCVKHSNMEFLLKAVKYNELIDRDATLKDVLARVVCNTNSVDCMYNQCSKCTNNKIEFKVNGNNNTEVKWQQWESGKHTYSKFENGTNKLIETRRTTKQTKTGTESELIQHFNENITLFKKHYFNMKIQQSQYQQCMHQLGPNEILIICDFSENYGCKLSEEVQSMHFGASRQQITLHCGMVYFVDKSQSFCTVSDDLCHEPAAIWAHLVPVIAFVKKLGTNVKVIHFFSDGPTSQYRQKKNYYLQSLFASKLKLEYVTWSYTESGHGKGVADGIGGSVKRNLDRQVSYGRDIRNAEDAYNSITAVTKAVKCFLIKQTEVESIKKIIPNNLKPITGNNNVHQIVTTQEPNVVIHRVLSCFCGTAPGKCSCYFPKKHLLTPAVSITTESSHKNTEPHVDIDATFHVETTIFSENLLNRTQPTDIFLDFKQDDVPQPNTSKCPRIIKGEAQNNENLFNSSRPTDVLLDLMQDDVPQPSTSKGPIIIKRKAGFNLVAPMEKKIKVIMPVKKEDKKENQGVSKSLKTIITRNFICHLCNLRQLFSVLNMVQCISCKSWVCRACSGKVHSIDYICDKCFDIE